MVHCCPISNEFERPFKAAFHGDGLKGWERAMARKSGDNTEQQMQLHERRGEARLRRSSQPLGRVSLPMGISDTSLTWHNVPAAAVCKLVCGVDRGLP